MRIAYFHTNTILSGWSNWAAARVMRRLGHEVLDAPIPTDARGAVLREVSSAEVAAIKRTLPTLAQLRECDVVFVSGPEYVAAWIATSYGQGPWTKLPGRTIGMFLESTRRPGISLPVAALGAWYKELWFPDPSDAEAHDGGYVRVGVDVEMFRPLPQVPKTIDAGFVGTLYAKRAEFLKQLRPRLGGLDFRAGEVSVRDVNGECQELWTELLVKNINQMRVQVALPSNNPMLTLRPFETMACGTAAFVPRTDECPFEDGRECVIFAPDDPADLADKLRFHLARPDRLAEMAARGLALVRRDYSLQDRYAQMLAPRSAKAA